MDEFGRLGVPSVTVCAYSNHLQNSTSFKKHLLYKHGLTPNDYVKKRIWTSNITGTSPEDLYEMITWKLEDLVKRVQYTLKGNLIIINSTTPNWTSFWTETRRKWEGRCFTFNPNAEMSIYGLSNIEVVSDFPADLLFSYHAKDQTMDEDLTGISFIAKQKQFYKLKVPNDIIWNRHTDSKPGTELDDNFDELRNGIAKKNMMANAGCVVPYINNNDENLPICVNTMAAKIAEETFEGHGPYYDLYNSDLIPPPCRQMHVDPVPVFTEPEWDGQTWVNAVFMKKCRVTKQQASYTWHSLYAEVGGFLGLLLGISVYQLGSLIDFIPDIFP